MRLLFAAFAIALSLAVSANAQTYSFKTVPQANGDFEVNRLCYGVDADELACDSSAPTLSQISNTILTAGAPASATGAIQFNVDGALAGDTSNLFWDDTNNRLGIGTNSPSEKLQIGTALTLHDGGHNVLGFGSSVDASLIEVDGGDILLVHL